MYNRIGSARSEGLVIFANFGLAPFRAILPASIFLAAAKQTGCAPQRQRPLTPEVLVWLMVQVALCRTSMTQGLALAWGQVCLCFPALNACAISEEAFSMARNALTFQFWRQLWTNLRHQYEVRFRKQMLWKGLRPLACDGTEVDLPNVPALVKFFTRPRTKLGVSKAPNGRLIALCSIFTGFCVNFMFVSRRFSEHVALRHLIRSLQENDLVLLDRGFFSYSAIYLIPSRKAHFLLRTQDNVARFAHILEKLGPDDWKVEFRPSARASREHPYLPKTLTCRLIRYQIPGFRISWLLTSLLDAQSYPADELIALYHQRWRIETIYREWKHGLDIQNLRSQTPIGIRKEIHAHLLLSNLVRWTMSEAIEGTAAIPIQLSFLNALTAIKNSILLMLRPNANCLQIYENLIHGIRAAIIRQRPGRSFPRPGEAKIKKRPHGVTRLPARMAALA